MRIVSARLAATALLLLTAACATPEGASSRAPGPVRTAAHATGDAARSAARATGEAAQRFDARIDAALDSLEKPEDALVADPFEGFNRAMYAFNNGLDRVILGPTANFYRAAVPQVGRNRVRDFIDNWKSPVWLANDVLQGDFDHAGVTLGRFAINTTVGVLGVYDYAAHHADLPKRDEDFGQTLGVYGVGNGPYLMLPVLGPTTFRDFGGTLVDIALDPFTWAEFEGDGAYRVTTRTVDIVDIREQSEPVVQTVRASVDPYIQARAVYIQSRNRRVTNGENEYEELPDFE